MQVVIDHSVPGPEKVHLIQFEVKREGPVQILDLEVVFALAPPGLHRSSGRYSRFSSTVSSGPSDSDSMRPAKKEFSSADCSGVFAVFLEKSRTPVFFVRNLPKTRR